MKPVSLTPYHSQYVPLLSSGDFLAQHSTSLGVHVSVIILLKGSLDALGSKLMPDKAIHGFGFACDGPSRSGTCDISA